MTQRMMERGTISAQIYVRPEQEVAVDLNKCSPRQQLSTDEGTSLSVTRLSE